MPIYSTQFFASIRDGARSSAEKIVPLVMELIQPTSVIDVGCAEGTWLSVFKDYGVKDFIGIDNAEVNKSLAIPPERFVKFDLKFPQPLRRKFDLVISLEVAEHLDSSIGASFIKSLTKLGPVILFSAAIPHQTGVHHVNEQWPQYWEKLFYQQGFIAIDCIRDVVWNDVKVDWWYAQNTLIYAKKSVLHKYPKLQAEYKKIDHKKSLSRVHPRCFTNALLMQDRGIINLTTRLIRAILERLRSL